MGGDACCLEVSRITGQLHRGVNIFDGDYPEGSEPLLESVRRLQQLFGRGANPVTLCQIYPADHAKIPRASDIVFVRPRLRVPQVVARNHRSVRSERNV